MIDVVSLQNKPERVRPLVKLNDVSKNALKFLIMPEFIIMPNPIHGIIFNVGAPLVGAHSVELRIGESGRRWDYSHRPPTPPGLRFRTKAVPINALDLNLNACQTISAQPYLVDSVHYFRLRPSFEDSAQFGQYIGSKSSTGSGLQPIP